MNEQLKELFKKAFNVGAMYEATLSNAYSFESFIEDNIEQLRLYGVVGQSEQLPQNLCTLNENTCDKGSGCKYPHCHL